MEVGESFALERADGSRAERVDFGNDRIRDDEKFDEAGEEGDEEGVNDDDALMGGGVVRSAGRMALSRLTKAVMGAR